jgi:hypothetical protein
MSKQKEIGFQLKSIELLDSCIITPKRNPTPIKFTFEIGIEQKFSLENKLMFVLCEVAIFSENNGNKEELLGNLKSNCIFELENINPVKNNKIDLSAELSTLLNSITISTTRGLMFSFFKGTFLHNAILPVVDPKSFKLQK